MTVYAHTEPHALLHPAFNDYVVPKPREAFDENDPLVKAHPWAFGTADEVDAADATRKAQEDGSGSVAIPQLETTDRSRRRTRTRAR